MYIYDGILHFTLGFSLRYFIHVKSCVAEVKLMEVIGKIKRALQKIVGFI